MPHPGILPSALRDKVGVFDHDRFRGYVSVHFRSGLHPPCLRFAAAVARHHARLSTRLLIRLCRGRHFRQLNFMRFQGATRTDPDGLGEQLRCLMLIPCRDCLRSAAFFKNAQNLSLLLLCAWRP
jgi:hypothetical protein